MSSTIEFGKITPILRIFDVAKADEFYVMPCASKTGR
jgi:hypothetical protein